MVADFNPIALSIGPLQIHWYALAYLAGFFLGWRYILWLARKADLPVTPQHMDEFLSWAIAGVLLGGRLGYTLIYNFPYYSTHPIEVLWLWQGGMSFHGGLVGIIAAILGFCHTRKIDQFMFGDLIAAAGPLGLFFGRIANFVNGELYGRPTTVPWGVIFPHAPDALPRHPSQLYEAGLEGLALFTLLFILSTRTAMLKKPGQTGGIFLSGYAFFRFMAEFFREPDSQLGFLWAEATMGQLLCLPMFAFGLWIFFHPRRVSCPRT
jgi:phosphatidylglycerol:prolipoprotein diacylglycerol transferase